MLQRRFLPLAIALLLAGALLGALGMALWRTPSAPSGGGLLPAPAPIVQTRDVPQTVIVTPTPSPTPTYVSKVDVPAGTLVYPLAADPKTLDPQLAADEAGTLLANQLYEGLFTLAEDGGVLPAAATSYTVTEDGKHYTIRLRAGASWSDGQPVTAQQFVDGMCRLLNPALGSDLAYLLAGPAHVAGAAEYATGGQPDCRQVGIAAPAALTLEITLTEASPALPQFLGMGVVLPARLDLPGQAPAALTAGEPATTTAAATATAAPTAPPTAPVGNGPYRIAEYKAGDHLTLVKNAGYWRADAVTVTRVELPILPNAADQFNLYLAGRSQVSALPVDQTTRIWDDARLRGELRSVPQPGVSYLGLNTTSGPTADLNFRRAIASAIDRPALLDAVVHQPWRTAAASWLPAGLRGYTPAQTPYGFDLAAAQRYLEQAGYGPGHPAPTIELWTNREGNNSALFNALADMLDRAGIPARLVTSAWPEYSTALAACPAAETATGAAADCRYALYRGGWLADYPDPLRFVTPDAGGLSGLQASGWNSTEYVGLLGQAAAATDPAERAAAVHAAEQNLLDNAVVIPLWQYERDLLVKAGLHAEFPLFGPPHFNTWGFR